MSEKKAEKPGVAAVAAGKSKAAINMISIAIHADGTQDFQVLGGPIEFNRVTHALLNAAQTCIEQAYGSLKNEIGVGMNNIKELKGRIEELEKLTPGEKAEKAAIIEEVVITPETVLPEGDEREHPKGC